MKVCTCPDPTVPLFNSDPRWEQQHNRMLQAAKLASKQQQQQQPLDLVFLGDSIVEQWNGTQSMGTNVIPGMREPFEKRFTIKGGGDLEALALGCSGDTVSSIWGGGGAR